jgi:hypothetical protein
MYERENLKWQGDDLCLGRRVLASVDRTHPGPGFRVRMPDGRLSDWANLTRIKDACCSWALADLNEPAELKAA